MRTDHLQLDARSFPSPAHHITGTSGFTGQVVCPVRCFVLVIYFSDQTEVKEDDVVSNIEANVLK